MSLNRVSILSRLISHFWSAIKCVWRNRRGEGWGNFGPESTLIQSLIVDLSLSEKDSETQRDLQIFCQSLILEMTTSNKVIVYVEVNVCKKSHHSVYSS